MDNPKVQQYFSLAEKAIESLGNLVVGGVDILDSVEYGLVVLEVNAWPDLFDIEYSTSMPVFARLAEAYVERLRLHVKNQCSGSPK